jgi:hypothetical protein
MAANYLPGHPDYDRSQTAIDVDRKYMPDMVGRPPNLEQVAKGLRDEAEQALSLADQLHKAIDDLEANLLPPGLKEVARSDTAEASDPRRDPLAVTVRTVRQRLDSATDRLGAIINRI